MGREEEVVERLMRDAASGSACSSASASGSTALPLIVAHNLRKRYAGARTSAVQVQIILSTHFLSFHGLRASLGRASAVWWRWLATKGLARDRTGFPKLTHQLSLSILHSAL